MTDNTIENMLSNSDLSLMFKIPHVLRARGYRLYLADGRRLVDLFLNGGAAVLGHTPANLLREIKNTASRGLYAPYPHFTEARFLKALSLLFPGRFFRLYAAPPEELAELFKNGKTSLWRPFVDPNNPFVLDDSSLFIPVIPGIQTWRGGLPFGLCVIAAKSEELLAQFPQSDYLSPILLAAATRGIYDILAALDRAKSNFPRIKKVLKNSNWRKQGIILTLKKEVMEEEWAALFEKFLKAGFLLPPSQVFPLILPGELSDGEEKKLADVLGRNE